MHSASHSRFLLSIVTMLMSMQMGRMDLSELDYDDDNDYFSRVDYDEDGRIGGGRLSSRAYQAALLVKKGDSYNLMCGGVIISDQWILTAAHCVADQTDLKRRLVMGTNDLKQGKGRSVRVEKVIVHQNYVPFDPITRPLAPLNDIALLRVQVPLPTQVSCCFKAIKLPDKQSAVPVGSSGIVSGYGSTSHLIKTTARLLEADVEILADEKCTFYWGAEFTSTSMTCAIGQGNRGICKGDSGGPLVIIQANEPVLWGLTSYFAGMCGINYQKPTIFTRLTSYIDWIQQETGKLASN